MNLQKHLKNLFRETIKLIETYIPKIKENIENCKGVELELEHIYDAFEQLSKLENVHVKNKTLFSDEKDPSESKRILVEKLTVFGNHLNNLVKNPKYQFIFNYYVKLSGFKRFDNFTINKVFTQTHYEFFHKQTNDESSHDQTHKKLKKSPSCGPKSVFMNNLESYWDKGEELELEILLQKKCT